jgi:hypothetical protein
MALRRRRRDAPVSTQAGLEQAQRALEHARAQRAEQDRKREQEQEGLIKRMERLAEENHLSGWVLDIISGSGGNGG